MLAGAKFALSRCVAHVRPPPPPCPFTASAALQAAQRSTQRFSAHASASVTASSDMYALAENGRASTTSVGSGEWLAHAPRGAYTTARTVNNDAVFELSFHVERLASSVRLMLDEESKAGSTDRALAQDVREEFGDAAVLRPRLLESLRAAVTQYRRATGQHTGYLKLTALLTWATLPPSIFCHVAPLPPRPGRPVKVHVRGAPRSNALAKDSEWVRQRRALEKDKPPDVNEVLLSDEQGRVFEGLSSNFAAVIDGAVHTAGEGILLGTVRQVMLDVCEQQGIPVILQPPSIQSIASWQGALISSTSRLVLPVDEVFVFGKDGNAQRHAFPRDGLVSDLEQLVLDAIAERSDSIEG